MLSTKTASENFQRRQHRKTFNGDSIGKLSTETASENFQQRQHRKTFNRDSIGKLLTETASENFEKQGRTSSLYRENSKLDQKLAKSLGNTRLEFSWLDH